VSKMSGARIIIVDDNPNNLTLFTALLKAHGADVIPLESGETCLEQVRAKTPQLILLDIQMPGMDGIATLVSLQAMPEAAGIPVVALTAYAMEGDRERLLADGFAGYIAKPIDTRAFPAEIARYLAS